MNFSPRRIEITRCGANRHTGSRFWVEGRAVQQYATWVGGSTLSEPIYVVY